MESSSAMVPSSALSLKLLDHVIKMEVDDAVVAYLVQYITAMIEVEPNDAKDALSTLQIGRKPKSSPSSKTLTTGDKPLPKLHDFVENISIRSRCTMATMLVTLIYLDRLQKVIVLKHPTAGKPCSRHRVIFSALMISHKIWNDSSMIGKHWAEVSNLFTSQEVLAMEREILGLLRYDLELTVEEIWNAARPFFKTPFLSVDPDQVAEAEASFFVASTMKHEAMMINQRITRQEEDRQSACQGPTHSLVRRVATLHSSQDVRPAPSHGSGLVHPYSSLHHSPYSSPTPFFDPFDSPYVYSPALQSSPLLASPLLQTIPHPAAAVGTSSNRGTTSLSHTHATRSSAGSTIRATRLAVRNVSNTTVPTKGTNAHQVYLHNPPQNLHHQQHHGHPIIAPAARLKKKKYIASVQRFHLPTSMHSHSLLRSIHSSSPHHSNSSTSSRSNSSSSSFSTSIPSSPSSYSAGSSINLYAQSPSMVWYAHPHEQQQQQQQHAAGPQPQPYYSYASALTLASNSTTRA